MQLDNMENHDTDLNMAEVERVMKLNQRINRKADTLGREIFNYIYWVYPALLKYGRDTRFHFASINDSGLVINTLLDRTLTDSNISRNIFPEYVCYFISIPLLEVFSNKWKDWLSERYAELLDKHDSRGYSLPRQRIDDASTNPMDQYLLENTEEIVSGIQRRHALYGEYLEKIKKEIY